MLIADLHIHSRYARATSADCTPQALELWARRKGIGLLGSGDFTHPLWRRELSEQLAPAEEGLYRLKDELRLQGAGPWAGDAPRFVISGEISSIYKQGGKVRKVHNLILLPSLEDAARLSARLEQIGNLHSDGRPILGLSSRDLLEITLECSDQAIFIPAHIWTPHFSLFGAFSGFDTIEECFMDLTGHIHALETGLSSDPPMNWRLSALDRFTLVSNSDAHSPARLGREANLLSCEMSYPALRAALGDRGSSGFEGTLEFFPEEGKYHFDGHRNCGQCIKPEQAQKMDNLCPVCGKRLTMGVLHRVEQLADRAEGVKPRGAAPFESLVPLLEVGAQAIGVSPSSKKAAALYDNLLKELGSEFYILRQAPLEAIQQKGGAALAECVRRMRAGQVQAQPGFDGEFGVIRLMQSGEIAQFSGQMSFIPAMAPQKAARAQAGKVSKAPKGAPGPAKAAADEFNPEQRRAVESQSAHVAVIAGPGAGKTKTLVGRIAFLIQEKGVEPRRITAVTFTNKAAREMRARLEGLLGKRAARLLNIGTFHALCLKLLRELDGGVSILDEAGALAVAQSVIAQGGFSCTARALIQAVSRIKNGVSGAQVDDETRRAADAYNRRLQEIGTLDFDDLLLSCLKRARPDERFQHLLVDEFQDINPVQYELVRAWSQGGQSLLVIGDPDQSIYGFRGSSARCFDRLTAEHPDLERIRLKTNYRSTPEILNSAMAVIRSNPSSMPRTLEAMRKSGPKIELLRPQSELEQAIALAKRIAAMVGGLDMVEAHARSQDGENVGFSDIAVLYRTHRQAELIEKCLRQEDIPYRVSGREPHLEDPSVRGTLNFFRFLLNSQDAPAMESCLELIFHCPDPKAYAAFAGPLSKARRLKLLGERAETPQFQRFLRALEAFSPLVNKDSPLTLLSGFCEMMELQGVAALEKLMDGAPLYPDMGSMLENLTLGGEADAMRLGHNAPQGDAVQLMTLHAAKGLEFPVVLMPGVNQGVLPLEMGGAPADIEEERRLFFVGLTRAQNRLILLAGPNPSPFLEDLPQEYLETAPQRPKAAARQLSFL